MFVDTHTHLFLEEFAPTPQDAVKRAIDAGVTKMIFPNVDLSTINPMKELSSSFPLNTFMAMGLHPTEIKETWVEDLAKTKEEFNKHIDKYIAIGEIGIDLYWDKTFRREQMQALEQQFQWAIDANIPVIIHCREGLAEILEVLDRMNEKPKGVFHSFGGTIDDVEQIRQRGDFYFGINGVVTFKNSKRLRKVVEEIPLSAIVTETDCPYMAPEPVRGSRNDSRNIRYMIEKIAEIKGMDKEECAGILRRNAMEVYRIGT